MLSDGYPPDMRAEAGSNRSKPAGIDVDVAAEVMEVSWQPAHDDVFKRWVRGAVADHGAIGVLALPHSRCARTLGRSLARILQRVDGRLACVLGVVGAPCRTSLLRGAGQLAPRDATPLAFVGWLTTIAVILGARATRGSVRALSE